MGFAVALTVGACSPGGSQGPSGGSGSSVRGDRSVLVTGARVFDGRRMLAADGVLFADGRITAIGAAGELGDRADERIDLGAATLMPGIIDLHVHLRFPYSSLLEDGITTVRDLGQPKVITPDEEARLRIVSAGPVISAPGGAATAWFPWLTRTVASPDEAQLLASRLVADGAGVLKLYLATFPRDRWPLPDTAVIRAVTREARRHGLLSTAHVDDARGTRRALAGGVDELAHAPCHPIPRSVVRDLVRQEVAVVATLHLRQRLDCPGAGAFARRFHRLGGQLLYGTDMGNGATGPDVDGTELRLMMGAGMTEAEVLSAATAKAGQELGLAPLGTLTAGAPADLVGVSGDPTSDIGALDEPVLVIAGGEVTHR